MRTNPIGHTIFVTSEEYRMTNQKTDTIFFTSEKIRIGFSRLSGRPCEVTESVFATFPAFPESWLQGLQTLIQWKNLSRTKKTKIQERKLNRMLLYLWNF